MNRTWVVALAGCLLVCAACEKEPGPAPAEPAPKSAAVTDAIYLDLWAKRYEMAGKHDAAGDKGWQDRLAAAGVSAQAYDAHAEALKKDPERLKKIALDKLGSGWNPMAVLVFAQLHGLLDETCSKFAGELMAADARSAAAMARYGKTPSEAEHKKRILATFHRAFQGCGLLGPDPEKKRPGTGVKLDDDAKYFEAWGRRSCGASAREIAPLGFTPESLADYGAALQCQPERAAAVVRAQLAAKKAPAWLAGPRAFRYQQEGLPGLVFSFAQAHHLVPFDMLREYLKKRSKLTLADRRKPAARDMPLPALQKLIRKTLAEAVRKDAADRAAAEKLTDDVYLRLWQDEAKPKRDRDESGPDRRNAARREARKREAGALKAHTQRLRCEPERARALLSRILEDEAWDPLLVMDFAHDHAVVGVECANYFSARRKYLELRQREGGPATSPQQWRELLRDSLALCGFPPP
ncbi:MAG: hypothetical protein JXR96_04585 [Deltaproteobacteria bacterium]|nr:hypothetical protein [Deltaproteobacteria bacterium]